MFKFLNTVSSYAQTETGRLLATLLVVGFAVLFLKLLQMRARARLGPIGEIGMKRGNFVLAKNMVLAMSMAVIFAIWASKIAGAALSLAAVAGAALIVSKEFLMNLLGSALLAISRPYSIGHFIEIDGVSGRVVDSDMLVTTLAETLEGSQITGRTVTIPNAMLLSKPVRNLTATGEFVINLMTVVIDPSADLEKHEAVLLLAANEVCKAWEKQADQHLKRVESRELVDLPSARARVILQMHAADEAILSVRYACRPNDRVWVEQAILRKYLKHRPLDARRDLSGHNPSMEKSI